MKKQIILGTMLVLATLSLSACHGSVVDQVIRCTPPLPNGHCHLIGD